MLRNSAMPTDHHQLLSSEVRRQCKVKIAVCARFGRLCEWVSSFLTTHQHIKGHSDYVSITADICTHRRAHSFLGVTVHMFGHGSQKPNSNLLAFRHFEGSHTGQHIADKLDGILEDFSIASKTHFIVTDNASNTKKALCDLFGTRAGCSCCVVCECAIPHSPAILHSHPLPPLHLDELLTAAPTTTIGDSPDITSHYITQQPPEVVHIALTSRP